MVKHGKMLLVSWILMFSLGAWQLGSSFWYDELMRQRGNYMEFNHRSGVGMAVIWLGLALAQLIYLWRYITVAVPTPSWRKWSRWVFAAGLLAFVVGVELWKWQAALILGNPTVILGVLGFAGGVVMDRLGY